MGQQVWSFSRNDEQLEIGVVTHAVYVREAIEMLDRVEP